MNNIACRIFAEQLKMLLALPNQEEAQKILYYAIINSFFQFENQNENQNENQFDYAYVSVSDSVSISLLGKSILDLLSKNIVWKEFSNNYGGKRINSGRKSKTNKDEDKKENITSENQKIHNKQTESTNANYKFIGDVIKLNEKDYNSWKEKYPLLDLDFELKKRDIWLANCDSPPKNWFISTAQYLLAENDKKQKEKDKRLKKWEDF